MAQRGRGAAALATAAIGSFVAGTLATLGLTFLAPALVGVALSFGPAEYFALMVLAFTTVSAVLGASRLRGAISLFFGLGLGLIGIDTQTGQARFTLGVPAAPRRDRRGPRRGRPVRGGRDALRGEPLPRRVRRHRDPRLALDDAARSGGARGSRGCAAPCSASRSGRCRPAAPRSRPSSPTWSRSGSAAKPEEFGKGAIEGVAGPEAANNAAAAGVLAPLLTLGLPDLGHRGHPAGRLPGVRAPAGAAPLPEQPRPRLGADREPVHRQRDAAGPEPAAGAASGCASS